MLKFKVFSKADLKDGFLHIELDKESSLLTTFQTPWGRYCWKRMPFGFSPAPELFQQKLDQNLEGLPGVHRIFDDLLITGKGDSLLAASQDHDRNLRSLLERCQERNIKLNREKFMFKCSQVPFIGHLLTREGLKPDPQKVEAICNMPKPEDVQAVQRFVNTVKYLSRFPEDLSDMSEPLRRLTHKDVPWEWSQEQEEAFVKIKTAVSTAPVLKFFTPSEPTEGEGDASEKGIGFALMQQGQPVTYASRALTKAEQNYSQIEKELLAQVFGMEHNHQYVYGRRVTLWTGLTISSNLKWNAHVSEIVSKAASRLFLLRQFKRACSEPNELLCFYRTCIRPVAEYACQAYHNSLPAYLSDDLERIQRRALRIIYPFCSYREALTLSGLTSLKSRRESLTTRLFKEILEDPNHNLHGLLPPMNETIRSLRQKRTFSIPRCKTKRYQSSFIIANALHRKL